VVPSRPAHLQSRLFEDLLVQAYAKKFTDFAGERFQVASSQANDDDSITVNSLINRPNGDVVRLDCGWRMRAALRFPI
jgi:ABC-type transporter MlaC component